MTRYDYSKLRALAVASDATQEDINALGFWFELYGTEYWNGEYYDAEDGIKLYEVIKWNDDLDQGEIIGYEIR